MMTLKHIQHGPLLYSRDSSGNIRTWQYIVDGDRWATISGRQDGKTVQSGWTQCQPKNVGKKNERSATEQALAEAEADMTKQLKQDYRRSIAELDSVLAGPMLAQPIDKVSVGSFPVFVQPKLDGIRALISHDRSITRKLQPHTCTWHIEQALRESDVWAHYDVPLDGELYNHQFRDDFNRISSLVRKKTHTAGEKLDVESHVQYHVYDIGMDIGFEKRLIILNHIDRLVKAAGWDHVIKIVDTQRVDTQDLLDDHYAELLADGYEGQMIRSFQGKYEWDRRSKHLIKRKTFITEEFGLESVEEGNGSWVGAAKSAKIRNLQTGKISDSGIKGSYEYLQAILQQSKKWDYSKAQVTCRFPNWTPEGKPRFPVIVDFHPTGRND